MILLGLKIIEADMIAHTTERSLVLLVDDIFSELDDDNAAHFIHTITPHQLILTSQKPLADTAKLGGFSCINLTLP